MYISTCTPHSFSGPRRLRTENKKRAQTPQGNHMEEMSKSVREKQPCNGRRKSEIPANGTQNYHQPLPQDRKLKGDSCYNVNMYNKTLRCEMRAVSQGTKKGKGDQNNSPKFHLHDKRMNRTWHGCRYVVGWSVEMSITTNFSIAKLSKEVEKGQQLCEESIVRGD